ncbi:hypothetical protein HK100_007792, partial [Physocladia obscura]
MSTGKVKISDTPRKAATGSGSGASGGGGGMSAANGNGNGKKGGIRSSIDLELQLGFEKNPLDKPSSEFRDAESWFSQAKQTAEISAAEQTAAAAAAEKDKEKRGTRDRRRNNSSSNVLLAAATTSTFGRTSARVAATAAAAAGSGGGGDGNAQQTPQQQADAEYVSPSTLQRSSFFRSSFFGGVPNNVRTLERSAAVASPTSAQRRPMGPRGPSALPTPTAATTSVAINDNANTYPNANADLQLQSFSVRNGTLSSSKDAYDLDPAEMLKTPVWYLQLRVWMYGLIFLSAFLAAVSVGAVASSSVAPSKTSVHFWIAVSIITLVVALAELLFFIRYGAKMLYHYDSPFLILTSSQSNPNNNGGLTKSLVRRDIFLPIFDLALHSVLTIFWIATLADFGTTIGSCRTETLNLGIGAGVCTGFEAGVSFG